MKKKMNLTNLKVKSFVTKIESPSSETVKGGLSGNNPACRPVQKWTEQIDCISQGIGFQSDCCPSEYGPACESGNITCYDEKDPVKIK